jgi:hypothetical protein
MFRRLVRDRLLPLRLRWSLRADHPHTLIEYPPEQAPPPEDLASFVLGAPLSVDLFGFRKARYVQRRPVHAVAWLQAYVACEVADLKLDFCNPDKSFHIVLLESSRTGDRSLAFRLTTRGMAGWTQWRLIFRRIPVPDSDDTDFLCEE